MKPHMYIPMDIRYRLSIYICIRIYTRRHALTSILNRVREEMNLIHIAQVLVLDHDLMPFHSFPCMFLSLSSFSQLSPLLVVFLSFFLSFSLISALEYFFTEISREAVAINDHWSCSTGGLVTDPASPPRRLVSQGKHDDFFFFSSSSFFFSSSSKYSPPRGERVYLSNDPRERKRSVRPPPERIRARSGRNYEEREGGGGVMPRSQSLPALRQQGTSPSPYDRSRGTSGSRSTQQKSRNFSSYNYAEGKRDIRKARLLNRVKFV